MLLAIDVGNTHTVIGLYQAERLLSRWRVHTNVATTSDEMAVLLRNLFLGSPAGLGDVDAVIISCVVPPLRHTLQRLCQAYLNLEPCFVGPGMKTGMPILYDNPKEVGADRIVNALAAYRRWRGDLIVVDFGTATTFDVVSAEGAYLGGAITPGIGISLEALFERASKLPRVEIAAKPKTAVGRDTHSSMQAGICYGYAGMVDGMVAAIDAERGTNSKVVATGGLAQVIAPHTKSISEVDPDLTLEGLRLLHELNS